VVLTDLQKLNAADLASAEAFYPALAGLIADQLGLDVAPDAVWNARRGPSITSSVTSGAKRSAKSPRRWSGVWMK